MGNELTGALESLFVVALVAALAPLVVGLIPRLRILQVVVLIVGGVIVGPQVLDLAQPESVVLLSHVGLGFLFLLAGHELDLALFRQRAGKLAVIAWVVSAAIAAAVVGLLAATGLLLLVVRGLPTLLIYRSALPRPQRVELVFLLATALPLLVALSEIGLESGTMLPENAAALVGAGVLSVLVFPAVAIAVDRRLVASRDTVTRSPL